MPRKSNEYAESLLTKEFLETEIFKNKKSFSQIAKDNDVPIYYVAKNCKKFDLNVIENGYNYGYHKDLIGKKFYMLTILDLIEEGKSKFFLCECDCGNKKKILCTSIRRKKNSTKSCGCIWSTENKTTHYKEIPGGFFGRLKRAADDRNIKVEITIRDIWDLFLKQNRRCALTGIELYFYPRLTYRTTVSVDRIDSSKDYTKDNIQIVHKIVNIMKNALPHEEFICFCNIISNRNPRSSEECERYMKKEISITRIPKSRFVF